MAESSKSEMNGETELTMCDVLEEEQELEEDANAVLGGSDDTNCSYDDGYVPRQALYACMSCTSKTEPAGICLACCYACHDGHEVVELYTKRNFRCDCGNSKFNDKRCSLKPDKEPLNVKNRYNQNFKGVYCVCSRPYPDLEDHTPDEMIQCIVCEDWYHSRHLGGNLPDNEDYEEMICSKCMGKHDFLYSYLHDLNNSIVDVVSFENESKVALSCEESKVNNEGPTKQENVESNEVNIKIESNVDLNTDSISIKKENAEPHEVNIKIESEGILNTDSISVKQENAQPQPDIKTENGLTTFTASKSETCILKTTTLTKSGPGFYPQNWRKELCTCSKCKDMYESLNCTFLLNPEDTIHAYEERGKQGSSGSRYDKGLSALSQLDRVKQMEAVRAYTNMKGQLKEYLRTFAENKRTVCENDIKEFFERIGKKQKLNNGVPHFCR